MHFFSSASDINCNNFYFVITHLIDRLGSIIVEELEIKHFTTLISKMDYSQIANLISKIISSSNNAQ